MSNGDGLSRPGQWAAAEGQQRPVCQGRAAGTPPDQSRSHARAPSAGRAVGTDETTGHGLQGLKGQGLRWLGVEGEPGLAEEAVDEAVLLLDAIQLVAHRGGELVGGAGGEVPQAVLHH